MCSDLKYAKPEVNRSMYGFDFSFKAFYLPVTFRSVETIKKLWYLELLLGPNTLLSRNTIGNFIIIIIKLYIYEQLGDDWANPMRAWFLLASSCTGPSDGTQVSYVQHLGFLIMLYKEQATKHISSSSCLILKEKTINLTIDQRPTLLQLLSSSSMKWSNYHKQQ